MVVEKRSIGVRSRRQAVLLPSGVRHAYVETLNEARH
jgi:hypothetical protein